jgi:rRNA maturation RNase YbeY
LKIRILYDNVKYRLKRSKKVLSFIEKVIRKENRIPGDLIFIVTSNREIKKINKEFLNHDYYTDVIAFDYSDKSTVNGEIYISYDTVKKNSFNYKVSCREEFIRVMIHGTLHLCGYDDITKEEKEIIMKKGEEWLLKFRD